MQRLVDTISTWLTRDEPPPATPLCDFNRLKFEVRPGDVILMEGRSHVAEVIKLITQSSWSHSALYIGRLYEIQDIKMRKLVDDSHHFAPDEQLILEALLGQGTIIAPLSKYQHDHLRVCRPEGLTPEDAHCVIKFAIKRLGLDYDWRQILDLARFLFPWSLLPRCWRSSLFQHNVGTPTKTVCSTLLAEAFGSVDYPILPFIDERPDGSLRFFKRNPMLFTPRDFDYSPYFQIIKYPYLGSNDLSIYRRLPWGSKGVYYSDQREILPEETTLSNESAEDEPIQEAKSSIIPFMRRKG